MLTIFPFSLNDVWNGVEEKNKQAFRAEFLHRCNTLSEKEFKQWISNDYSFYCIFRMADPRKFNDMQTYMSSSISRTDRRNYARMLTLNQNPYDEMCRIFRAFPHLVDTYTDYLFEQHTNAKQDIDDLIIYFKCSLPFTYKSYHNTRVYVFRETFEKRKVSRLITFGIRQYKGVVDPITIDLQKNYNKLDKLIHTNQKVKRMVGVLYRDCDLILDLIRICGLYCPSIYLDQYGRKFYNNN